MGIVAGLDSSPEGTNIVVCDADTGAVLKQGYARHQVPESADEAAAYEADPQTWLLSLGEAADGGVLEGVQAIGVAAQQHAVIPLDAAGAPVRHALIGNDKRAQGAAADLTGEFGGRAAWAEAVGAVPDAKLPVTKLRRFAATEPDHAKRTAQLMTPHDWLVWQLLGKPSRRTTDRGSASTTGYWSAHAGPAGEWRRDLVELALGHEAGLPEVLGPAEAAGRTPEGLLISAGTGETMAAVFGLGLGAGDAVVTLGASGAVYAVHDAALPDSGGTITALADATGKHLPVVHTLNAVRALRGAAELLGLAPADLERLSELALTSTPGAHGLVLLPYLDGERTPSLPQTAGSLHGLRRESMRPEHLARAAFEGMLCGLADALEVLRTRGVTVRRVFLLGAAAGLPAVQALAPAVFEAQVVVPASADYAALGAARQAAWALGVAEGRLSADAPPVWETGPHETFDAGEDLALGQAVRQQYAAVRESVHPGALGLAAGTAGAAAAGGAGGGTAGDGTAGGGTAGGGPGGTAGGAEPGHGSGEQEQGLGAGQEATQG
ncbi:FGGY family carbohydrate kinase [Streptomyces sp. WMMC500]|uniref:FGGY family carbohydrate kinase n=1 Tax=Streptomyces sp. WMMC500 TaxID=3015154 RepID=UPI00248ADDB6|nr:FGGY family carbohydrate kinase [Streptomyces sp. WMMC500]WBB59495.1 FGGY family carbohydrate kinase [Streptomyces sp. WMMC500]